MQGSRLCLMCPENMTNPEDGSSSCPLQLQPGTNLTMRYAVIVSFGVFLNGTSLDDIAAKVGCLFQRTATVISAKMLSQHLALLMSRESQNRSDLILWVSFEIQSFG